MYQSIFFRIPQKPAWHYVLSVGLEIKLELGGEGRLCHLCLLLLHAGVGNALTVSRDISIFKLGVAKTQFQISSAT